MSGLLPGSCLINTKYKYFSQLQQLWINTHSFYMNFILFFLDKHPYTKTDTYKLSEPANTVNSDSFLNPKIVFNYLQSKEILSPPILPFIYSILLDRCHSAQKCHSNCELGSTSVQCPLSFLFSLSQGYRLCAAMYRCLPALCTPHSKHPFTGLLCWSWGQKHEAFEVPDHILFLELG